MINEENMYYTTVVSKPRITIINSLMDLHYWLFWMPLFTSDHSITTIIPKNGNKLSWKSEFSGNGKLVFKKFIDNSLVFELSFLEPEKGNLLLTFRFKTISISETFIELQINDYMLTSVSKSFIVSVKSILKLSLVSLKAVLEGENVVNPIIDRGFFFEIGFKYTGILINCTFEDLRQEISKSFEIVRKELNIKKRHSVFIQKVVVYKSYDLSNNNIQAIVGFIDDRMELDSHLISSEVKSSLYRCISFNSSSKFLYFSKLFYLGLDTRMDKSQMPYELYYNTDVNLLSNNLTIELNYPILKHQNK